MLDTDRPAAPSATVSSNSTEPKDPTKWYVVRSEPRADHLAATELGLAGFEVFSPRVKTLIPPGHDTDAPLFPGYLFLRCRLEDGRRPSLRGAPHVAGWLHFDGVVPAVPDEVVDALAAQVHDLNRQGGLWQRFKKGDRVRVASNNVECLAEVVGDAGSPRSRVKVLLQFMGGLVPAQVPRECLQLVEDSTGQKSRHPRRTRGRGRWIRGSEPAGPKVPTG